MIRLLVVEDNVSLLDDMLLNFKAVGFEAIGVSNSRDMDEALQSQNFDILVLDIGLPDESGFDITQRVKAALPEIGIIIVTAESQLSSRVLGHKLGADHYLTKPVNYMELSAIVESLFNRIVLSNKSLDDESGWKLDVRNMLLLLYSDELISIDLTWSEVQILKMFASSECGEVTKDQLIDALDENKDIYDVRRLETIISRLRKKVSTHVDVPLIKSKRNFGYQFLPEILFKD